MAVLVEGISVVVRRDSIRAKAVGGEKRFRLLVPNATFCQDDELARVGFLSPGEAERFVAGLQEIGLVFIENGHCIDIAICDQQRGLTVDCGWMEFGHLPIEGGKVGAAWLFEGERVGHGIHLPAASMMLATPSGREFKGALSDRCTFVPDGTERH